MFISKVRKYISLLSGFSLPSSTVFPVTLKKQVGCFNYRVVTLVAILSGLHKVSFGI